MEEKRKQHQQQSQGQQHHHQSHHHHENVSQQTQRLYLKNSTTIPTTGDKQQAQISLTNVKTEAKIVETVAKEKHVKATIATEARKKTVKATTHNLKSLRIKNQQRIQKLIAFKEAKVRNIRMRSSKIKDFKMHQKQTASKANEDILSSPNLEQGEDRILTNIKAPEENQRCNIKRKIDHLEKPKALRKTFTVETEEQEEEKNFTNIKAPQENQGYNEKYKFDHLKKTKALGKTFTIVTGEEKEKNFTNIKAPEKNQCYNKKRKINHLEKPKALGKTFTVETEEEENFTNIKGPGENQGYNKNRTTDHLKNPKALGKTFTVETEERCFEMETFPANSIPAQNENLLDDRAYLQDYMNYVENQESTEGILLESYRTLQKLTKHGTSDSIQTSQEERIQSMNETPQQLLQTPIEIEDSETLDVKQESPEDVEEDHHMKQEYFETETYLLQDVFQERYANANTLTKNVSLLEEDPKRNKQIPIYCYFKNCPNHLTCKDDVQLFKFPTNRKLRQYWIENFPLSLDFSPKTKKATKKKTRVWLNTICAEHFEKQCLRETRLLYGSIPTLNLGVESKIKRNCDESLNCFAKRRCKVPHCQRSQKYDDIFKIKFPQGELRTKWCFNLNLKEEDILPMDWICNKHFEKRVLLGKTPRSDAVPTLCLGDAIKSSDLYQSPEYVTVTEYAKQFYETCCVKTCPNTTHNSDFTFASFVSVKSPDIYKKWLFNLDLEDSTDVRLYYRICLAHFESVCVSKFHGLKVGSIPTLNLDKKVNLFEIDRKAVENARDNLSWKKNKKLLTQNTIILGWICQYPQCLKQRNNLQKWPNRGIFKTIWLQTLAIYPETKHNIKEQVAERDVCDDHFYILYKTNKTYMESFFQDEQSDLRGLFDALKTIFDDLSAHRKFISRRCIVPQCCTDQLLDQYKDINLYSFPKLQDVAAKWCYNCNIDIEVLQQKNTIYKICKLHFEPYCFTKGFRYLWSVPTLNLPDSKPEVILQNDPNRKFAYTGQCCIKSCPNAKGLDRSTKTKFFRFPDNPEMLVKWLRILNCGNVDLHQIRICGLHFHHSRTYKGFNALRTEAFPTERLEGVMNEDDVHGEQIVEMDENIEVKQELDNSEEWCGDQEDQEFYNEIRRPLKRQSPEYFQESQEPKYEKVRKESKEFESIEIKEEFLDIQEQDNDLTTQLIQYSDFNIIQNFETTYTRINIKSRTN